MLAADGENPAEPLPDFLADDKDEAGDSSDDEQPHTVAAE